MLFHFSFYSNKQPAVPACSHNHSVELGEYHLSKVKFPGKGADQSRLSISELVLRSLRLTHPDLVELEVIRKFRK